MAMLLGKKLLLNLMDVGLLEVGGPNIRGNLGLNSEPSLPITSLRENVQFFKEPVKGLGLGNNPAGQARSFLDQSDSNLATQRTPAVAGRDSRSLAVVGMQNEASAGVGIGFIGKGSIGRVDLKGAGRESSALSLDVGDLDSGKHSAVVFHKNMHTKESNSVPSSNNQGFSPTIYFGSGKALRNRGRGAGKKMPNWFLVTIPDSKLRESNECP
ncbi:hypothetical protein EPI10_006856 [Gossypium australe]|uniref:Uncharacterized protein n=1 Tax=Gossypium australe TaxID=47621 RepID=A0A5B6WUM3_9ROSI|nr:hypothetical protein EPI10_006856 [Gossypium australe]